MAIPLSETLKNVKNTLNDQASKQTATGQAANGVQVQQALTAGPTVPGVGTKTTAQQMSPQIVQANAQVATQANAANIAATQEASKQVLQTAANQQQQQLKDQQVADEAEISNLQRQGKLKQNSAELDSAKRIQDQELGAQKQLSVAGTAFDNNLSFLTRKQREDLSKLGNLTRQQLFDSRLQFAGDENQRKFTNMRQLADYATAASASDEQLKGRLQIMQEAYEMESIVLEAANKKITQQLELEMRRAEQSKDNALALELAQRKAALERKMARKRAQAAGIGNIISGTFTIAGAVAGGIVGAAAGGVGAAPGAAIGSQIGSAAGGAVAGAVTK